MNVSLIAAIARNGIIGRDGDLPWHLPADLAHFKDQTQNRTIIMGRKTYDSIGRPLPRRRNIVLSRGCHPDVPGIEYFSSLPEALELLQDEEVVLIGGAGIYALGIEHCSKMHLTLVHQDMDGDVVFPRFDESAWSIHSERFRSADQKNQLDMTFLELVRTCDNPGLKPLPSPFPEAYRPSGN